VEESLHSVGHDLFEAQMTTMKFGWSSEGREGGSAAGREDLDLHSSSCCTLSVFINAPACVC
jgi:hypothetical protein